MIKKVTNSYSVGAVSGFSTKETGKNSLRDSMVSGTLFDETETNDYEVDFDNPVNSFKNIQIILNSHPKTNLMVSLLQFLNLAEI